jgi:mxaJ protein
VAVNGWWYASLQPAAAPGPTVLVLPPMTDSPPPPVHRPDELWVCADPDNLPYSNARHEGFENRIAALVARTLGRELHYAWQPSGERFTGPALAGGECDVVVGTPAQDGPGLTRPYYRSSYVFVSRADRARIASFADPRLDRLTVGVQLSGDDADAPPARAMAAHGRAAAIRGYVTNSLVAASSPARRIVDAVAAGEIGTAAVWGPLAGYYAAQQRLVVTPIATEREGGLQFAFDIAMATRGDAPDLVAALDRVLVAQRPELTAILRAFHVPLLPTADTSAAPPAGTP